MAVERIEEYRQLNGVDILKVILKPTRVFPDGYFYAPAEAIELVQKFRWYLHKDSKRLDITAVTKNRGYPQTLRFSIELFKYYHGRVWDGVIDHISMVEYDNSDENLNAVTSSQNKRNMFTCGYYYFEGRNEFVSRLRLNSSSRFSGVFRSEDYACTRQNYLEQVTLRESMGDKYYQFDFKKYRRGSEDILDLERTGQISEDEATYRHILKYADNAWYYLRFGLQEYFKDNNIPIPTYSLDESGFMVHSVTGEKLCPFIK